MGAVQLTGQGLQLGLGHQRVGVVVGAAHALGDGGGHGIWEPVGHIPELVQLTALDDGMVEHVGDGAAQGLGTVDHDQDGPSYLQATLAQADQQVTHHGGVLSGTLGQPERDLGPIAGDPERDHAGVLGDLDAVDHERDQVQLRQIRGEQLGQGVLGRGPNRRETADFEVPLAACSTWLPTGSSPAP